jgi:phosphatidylinositol 4-phosphatase
MPSLFYSSSARKISWETEYGIAVLRQGAEEEALDTVRDEYTAILGILNIKKSGGVESYLAYVRRSTLVGSYEGIEIYKIERIRFLSLRNFSTSDELTAQLKTFIQSHDFYHFIDRQFMDDEFVWNKHMQLNLLRCHGNSNTSWTFFHVPESPADLKLSVLFCGFFTAKTFEAESNIYHLKLLSMVSSNKIGTRLLSRGVDMEGNVSFFVTSSVQVKRNNKVIFNFNILRGSIPIFWEQRSRRFPNGINIYGEHETVRKAFVKHFEKLRKMYKNVHVINLLGRRRHERELSLHFTRLLEEEDIPHTDFDLNYYTSDYEDLKFVLFFKLRRLQGQNTVFRVNCLDCLDRTNIAQFLICSFFFKRVEESEEIMKVMQRCWAENGDSLSNLYTGSDAMKSELALKGRRSLFGYVDDLFISATRLINGNFSDRQKHYIINALLEREDDFVPDKEESLLE